MNSKWFYITIVAYRYYTPVFWFPLRRKKLSHDPTEFTASKQVAVLDQWTLQDQKPLFSVQTTSCKFSNIHQLSERFALTHINSVYQKWNCMAMLHIFGEIKLWWYWNSFRFSSGKRLHNHDVAATLTPGRKANVKNTTLWLHCENMLSDVTTKKQQKPNVVTTLCASWVAAWLAASRFVQNYPENSPAEGAVSSPNGVCEGAPRKFFWFCLI